MPTEIQIVRADCSRCGTYTKHDVKCQHTSDGGDAYHCQIEHMVIECRGCETLSFRYVFKDFENAYPINDDEWDIPETIETYPKFLVDHQEPPGTRFVPEIVREIYEETLTALREDARILAGLGLRGTIEAICNDREIIGRSLEIKISKLASQGLISSKDAERLHAIRFLGNDAAHDIKKASKKQLKIALRIIEHLIITVYILDEEARGKLDTIITTFEYFVEVLERHLHGFKAGDEYPLAKFLNRDVRRIEGSLSKMEDKLIEEINAGRFKKLGIGKLDNYAASPTKLQHFKVA